MAERKNIFLIGRRGHEGDEDQLTEMLAFLWQEDREALDRWLDSLGLATDAAPRRWRRSSLSRAASAPTSSPLERLDHAGRVEAPLRLRETQIADYLDFLGGEDGRRALVLLTQRPEVVPAEYSLGREVGRRTDPDSLARCADCLGEPGEETLAGDFIQLLIREGLVKPHG